MKASKAKSLVFLFLSLPLLGVQVLDHPMASYLPADCKKSPGLCKGQLARFLEALNPKPVNPRPKSQTEGKSAMCHKTSLG